MMFIENSQSAKVQSMGAWDLHLVTEAFVSKIPIEGKKSINKVLFFTSLFNWVIGVMVFFLPTYKFSYLNSLPTSEGWKIAYQPFSIGFLISIIGCGMTFGSLLRRRVRTPELIAARKVSNIVLLALSGVVLCIAIYETFLVSGVVR
ncbi:MAG: hypothetical protein EBT65_06265 [Actinobacteria bacterium]|nr:hypothetical protein [Actinomycetota bacterium]